MIIKKLSTLVAYVSVFILLSLVMDYWRGRALPENHIPYDSYIDISGKPVDIKTLSGNGLTVVYFWATWCGPCKVTSPSVKYLAKHYPVVSIALKSGEDDALTKYFNNTESVIPIVNDTDGVISKQWGVHAVPTVLFIKDKKILSYTMGASGYPGLLARAWLAQVFH